MSEKVPLPPENVFGHRKKLEFLRARISDHARRLPDRKVRLLDVGCSNGQMVTVHLGDLGADILAIDPHEPSIEYAIEHNPCPEGITFRAQTIGDVCADERFDIIVMADVLEHLRKPGEVLDAARERLVEGGIILASIPNGYGPFEIENALDRRGFLGWSYWLFSVLQRLKARLRGRRIGKGDEMETVPYAYECGHVQFWTLRAFRKLVESHGLEISEVGKGPWLGALCTSTWWGRSAGFCRWNARMGDVLPFWMVSTWYFVIEPASHS